MFTPHLLLVGASVRAAAFSALRAGMRPECVDLFADLDLQRRCAVTQMTERYPQGFQRFLESERIGPWMYTGALENHPRFVQGMARQRPLWGNAEDALSRCRDPELVSDLLRAAGMPVPAVASSLETFSPARRWLLKPRRGASGVGIRFGAPGESIQDSRDAYFQEFIEGELLALLFLGGERTARLLGVTRQLIGVPWLHAAPFRYCGSIGPLDADMIRQPALTTLGHVLASECFLAGLFGVDGVLREGTFWPVEINPRYTASVEVLEYATQTPLLGFHTHVFTHHQLPSLPVLVGERTIGKAILYAREDLHFPAEGPWMTELRSPRPIHELPAFADIPAAGERIEAGKPVLTFFAAADSAAACEDALRQIAADLDRWLFQ